MKSKRRRSTSQAINSIVSAAVSPADIENLNSISDGGVTQRKLTHAALIILLRDDVRYAALVEIVMEIAEKGAWTADRKVGLIADVMGQMGLNSKMDDVARLALFDKLGKSHPATPEVLDSARSFLREHYILDILRHGPAHEQLS